MKLMILLELFRDILISTHKYIECLERDDKSECFKQNWLQANWEMVFERFLSQEICSLVVLDYYGEGSEDLHYSLTDKQEGYNRVSLPSLRPTHTIVCHPKEKDVKCEFSNEKVNFHEVGLVFGELVAMKNDMVVSEPPYDCVLLINEPFNVVVPISLLELDFVEISEKLKK